MTVFTHDLTISAVPYDALLVADLCQRLAPSLPTAPYWPGRRTSMNTESDEAREDSSRLTLVLHQRLWQHDRTTQADEVLLRQRVHDRAPSVRVVTLDDEPVPDWLAPLPRCSLSAVGVDGVTAFTLDAVAACGGATHAPAPAPTEVAVVEQRWGDAPQPFLSQSRAFSALKRELDAIAAELGSRVPAERGRPAPGAPQLHCSPQRFVVQLGPVGVSFSWVAGRNGTVGSGRLLVIEWEGVVSCSRGITNLKTAAPVREQLYQPEAATPDGWCWRAEGAEGAAYSSPDLVGQWYAGAMVAARAAGDQVL